MADEKQEEQILLRNDAAASLVWRAAAIACATGALGPLEIKKLLNEETLLGIRVSTGQRVIKLGEEGIGKL